MTRVKLSKSHKSFRHLRTHHRRHPNLAVVLYVRVSSKPRPRHGTLAPPAWRLHHVCQRLGTAIVAVFRKLLPPMPRCLPGERASYGSIPRRLGASVRTVWHRAQNP